MRATDTYAAIEIGFGGSRRRHRIRPRPKNGSCKSQDPLDIVLYILIVTLY